MPNCPWWQQQVVREVVSGCRLEYRFGVFLRLPIYFYIVTFMDVSMNLFDGKLHERIVSKKQLLDSHRPLSAEKVRKLREAMEIEYTYHSNAIEGNRLTFRETQLVIREGVTIGGKSLRDHLEAQNHPRAILYVEGLKDRDLTENDVLELHRLIFSGILESAGGFRRSQVFIEGSDYMPPPAFEVPALVKELLEWLRKNPEELRPVEVAAVFHHKFVSIHPFDDGNGRVARLLMNLLLIGHGYPFTVVRSYDRRRYYDTLRKADAGDLAPFVNFIGRCVEESLDLYLSAVEPSDRKKQFLSLAEASKLTPYSAEYLSLLARKGLIAAVKIGKDWHVTPEALNEYMTRTKLRKHRGN
jgi:Fic family protein